MRIILILIISIFFSGCFHETVYKNFNGSNKVQEEISMLNGERDGKSITYYYSIDKDPLPKKSVETWKEGKRHGLSVTYYPNGIIESMCNYIEDKKDDLCTSYYDDGGMKTIMRYRNGVLEGDAWEVKKSAMMSRDLLTLKKYMDGNAVYSAFKDFPKGSTFEYKDYIDASYIPDGEVSFISDVYKNEANSNYGGE